MNDNNEQRPWRAALVLPLSSPAINSICPIALLSYDYYTYT